MSRVAVVIAAAAVLGVWLGSTTDALAAVAVVIVVAVVAAYVIDAWQRRQINAIVERVNTWMSEDASDPLQVAGGRGWRQLAIALNALGAGYRRRGLRLARERPWRRELVDSLVQPALLFGRDGRLQAANDAARQLLGIPVDAGAITVVQAVGSAALADAVTAAREARRPITLDVEHGDHELRSVVSLVGEETLLLIADRTRERRIEELRRNFVVNASHELKTPVTSIKTLTEAIEVTLESDPDRVPSLVGRLGIETDRLARLVRDLLDLRRLEERGAFERVAVDLAETVRLAVAEAMERFHELDIGFEVDVPDRAVVTGIPADVEVIVVNLIHNAVQYNRPNGRVEVSVEPGSGVQILRVRDTGIGIPQQDMNRIFERFYRVDMARSRETGGTGLGLSIVRHAVERHGGRITVDSLLGEGTTFTVILPVAAEA